MKKETETKSKKLPEGITKIDLKYPSYRSKDGLIKDWASSTFDIWDIEDWGWVIPTLEIGRSRRHARENNVRTYAVRVDDGKTVRVGLGPHVKGKHTVYVRKSRFNALKKYVEMKNSGAADANQIRDRISTRRMRSSSWGW